MTAFVPLLIILAFVLLADSNFGVGAQYDTTHVYVQPEDFDKFVASLLATFGGTATKQDTRRRRDGYLGNLLHDTADQWALAKR